MTLRIEKWSLGELAEVLGGELTAPSAAAIHVSGVSTDTRSIADGALFVALRGDRFDGHEFLVNATESGASAAVVDARQPDAALPLIVVPDTLVALQRLAHAVFESARESGVRSIALTGSNGKTTTKELIAAIWSVGHRVHATKGNFNNHIGLPLTICAMPDDAEVLVLEMGANQFGDIAELVSIAPADVRVITSIGHAHLEKLLNLEGVRRVKSEIFDDSDDALLAVVPELERMQLWLNAFGGSVATVGAAYEGGAVSYRPRGGHVELTGPDLEYQVKFSLPGAHNQANLATALATLLCGPWRPNAAALQAALDSVELPAGRWRTIRRGRWTVLDDAYNANPSSVRASWNAFVEIAAADDAVVDSEIVAIIGEMFELGEQAEVLHRDTAAWLADRGGANTLVFVGQYADVMAQAAAETTGMSVEAFDDPNSAGEWLAHRPPCVVYLKASRGQKLEALIEHLPE